MKKTPFIALPCLALLAACTGTSVHTTDNQLDNPLYAERYYDALVDSMVNLVLQNDPLAKDEQALKVIEKYRVEGLRQANKATEKQSDGISGQILSDFDYSHGEVLLLNNTVYVGPDFDTVPGPDLRAYISSVVDPRAQDFPDETAIDLGPVKAAFGAHSYTLPESTGTGANTHSFVLYERRLNRIFGFAQLQKR